MPGLPSSDALLNGWKEIAAYLGKSVRAVQRWERDFGLPVRRIRTPNGHVVYASRQEIDDWRRRSDASSQAPGETPGPELAAAGVDAPRRVWSRGWQLATGFALLIAGTGAVMTANRWTRLDPTKFVLSGNALEALASDGRVQWRHVFDRPVSKLQHEVDPINVLDTDGDGVAEVMVRVHLLSRSGEESNRAVSTILRQPGSAVYCSNSTGACERGRLMVERDV